MTDDILSRFVDFLNKGDYEQEQVWAALGSLNMNAHNMLSDMLYVQQQERVGMEEYYERWEE